MSDNDMRREAEGAREDVAREADTGARTIRDQANEFARHTGEAARGRAESEKDGVADRIEHVADTAHDSAERLRGEETWLSDALDVGARELGGMASSLRSQNLGDIATKVERFARQQPGLFVGASVALGFALARFAQSSAENPRPSQTRRRSASSYGPAGYGQPDRNWRPGAYSDPASQRVSEPMFGDTAPRPTGPMYSDTTVPRANEPLREDPAERRYSAPSTTEPAAPGSAPADQGLNRTGTA